MENGGFGVVYKEEAIYEGKMSSSEAYVSFQGVQKAMTAKLLSSKI